MKATDILKIFKDYKLNTFNTKDIAFVAKISQSCASHHLADLEKSGHIQRLKRGYWALTGTITPLALPNLLTASIPTYISLYSALYYHGLVEQIPSTIYAITAGRTEKFSNALGDFSFHHADLPFVTGFRTDLEPNVNLAISEKALVDTLYLQSSRSPLFYSLPELDIPQDFAWNKAEQYVELIPHKPKRIATSKKLALIRSKR